MRSFEKQQRIMLERGHAASTQHLFLPLVNACCLSDLNKVMPATVRTEFGSWSSCKLLLAWMCAPY